MNNQECCAVLGQAPMRFPWGFDEEDSQCKALKLELLQQIMALRQMGVARFMVACDPGVGLYAAEAVNLLRETDADLMLFCVTPYEEQATKWAPYLRERYFTMLEKCTHLTASNSIWTPSAQLDAYKRIIGQSDLALSVYDPAAAWGDASDKAMDDAAALHKPCVLIHPDTLAVWSDVLT